MATVGLKFQHLLLLTLLLVLLPSVQAFGAGDIPDFAYLEGKAFRHGDIESVLSELYKNLGGSHKHGSGATGFLLGMATAIATGGKGQKFSSRDVKNVYFGNWLRDYSQCMDIAGLSKLTAQSLITIVSILGFMEFGYATREFQVTADRLGVYLPVEHIDNPKGYAEKEGDARQFHPKLRPPVNPEELEIDERNGMKNYMATEDRGWATSTAHIRQYLKASIYHMHECGGEQGDHLFEAYRCLGTALHTLEDLLAHSNWCELALLKMGHSEVFCHVGDNVRVNTPNGQAPPMITGTFGGADFLHSLLGESQDHLSQSSITDLAAQLQKAKQDNQGENKLEKVKLLLGKLPVGGGADQMQKAEDIKAGAVDLNPDKVAPEELQQKLWEILVWRDNAMRDIEQTISRVPGLEPLLEQINLALMEYVYTVIEPWITPLIINSTKVLRDGSSAVIDTHDQYEVFTNPNASDPSHSMLSKDHFGLLLNQPAGLVAKVVVQHTVNVIVQAWFDTGCDQDQVCNKILEAFHHPYYASGSSEVQNSMFEEFRRWFGGLGSDEGEVLKRLTKDSVRNGKNIRLGSEDNTQLGAGGHGSHSTPSYGGQSSGGYQSSSNKTNTYGGGYQSSNTTSGNYGSSRQDNSSSNKPSGGYGSTQSDNRYGGESGSYGRRNDDSSTNYSSGGGYGSSNRNEESYGSSTYGSRKDNDSYNTSSSTYGNRRNDDNSSSTYGGRNESSGYGSRRDNDNSSYNNTSSYGQRDNDNSTYGRRNDNDSSSYGRNNDNDSSSYGRRNDNDSSSYGRRTDNDTYSSSGYGRRNDDNDNSSSNYGRRNNDNDNSSSTYGRRDNDNDNSYNSSSYGRRDNDTSYNTSSGYGSRNEERTSGYGGGSYGRSNDSDNYGSSRRNDDTFGAERLNINDNQYGGKPSGGYGDDDENRHHGKKHHGGGGYGGNSGYGGGYGGSNDY